MHTLFSVLHVVAAVFIIGPMAALPMSALRSIRSGHADQVATLAKSTRLFSLLSLAVVIFGFAVMGMADPRYDLSVTTPWVLASIVLYAIALAINLLVVIPALGRVATGATRAAPTRIAIGSGAVALLLLAVTTLMVWKP